MINQMKPLNYELFPDKTYWNSIKDGFHSITGKVTDFFKDKFGLLE